MCNQTKECSFGYLRALDREERLLSFFHIHVTSETTCTANRSTPPTNFSLRIILVAHHHHHHRHQGMGHLARSVSRVTAALANVSSVSRLFSFLVDCSGMILKGFGCVAFFACVKASSFCIHLSCLVCIRSIVHDHKTNDSIRRRSTDAKFILNFRPTKQN